MRQFRGADHTEATVQVSVRDPGTPDSAGQVQVHLATDDRELVRRRAIGVEALDIRGRRHAGQEGDVLQGDVLAAGEERVGAHHRRDLLAGAQDDRRRDAVHGPEPLRNRVGKSFHHTGGSCEDDVAALHIGPHVRASLRLERSCELDHGQPVLAADVETADQGHVHAPSLGRARPVRSGR